MLPATTFSVFRGDDVECPDPREIFGIQEVDLPRKNTSQPIEFKEREPTTDRSLLIVRHGERIDFVFGSWVPYCMDDEGNYKRRDLNMPKSLPKRKNARDAYLEDSPLTNVGIHQASMIGEAVSEKNINIKYAFCSPSFRCVQTCDGILRQVDKNIKIRIEPGLFEMFSFYKGRKMQWMTPEELSAAGYNIDLEYKPVFSVEEVVKACEESSEEFYRRNALVTETILNANPTGSILLVAHSSSLDTCSHKLLGRSPKTFKELLFSLTKVPFCATLHLEFIDSKWAAVEPFLPITHGKNFRVEWNAIFN